VPKCEHVGTWAISFTLWTVYTNLSCPHFLLYFYGVFVFWNIFLLQTLVSMGVSILSSLYHFKVTIYYLDLCSAREKSNFRLTFKVTVSHQESHLQLANPWPPKWGQHCGGGPPGEQSKTDSVLSGYSHCSFYSFLDDLKYTLWYALNLHI